ncbi:M23 family metallopeptidase [Streptomyces sp. NRRL B-24484]|uniref:M23 family metallopeptidase n=1 Tax=Streptomyces sp. NRRL B-24484 TaxID=1463833 RepID=UPI000693D71A|nr:M23 family metallopeptidase [Streptomyces sp. NRRL B-24484]
MPSFSDATRRIVRTASAGTAAALLNARSLSSRALNGGLPGTTAGSFSGVRAAASPLLRNRAKVASGGVAALALGALLLPGHAAAQTTVHPTVPGSSVFSASAAPQQEGRVVQVSAPTTYKQPRSASAQDSVAVAHNLAQPPAEQPQPAAQPQPEQAQPAQPAQQAQPQQQAQPAPAPAPAQPGWSSPAPGAPTSNPYHKTNHSYAAGFHTGVDFAVRPGTPLVSVGDATVVSAGWAGAYGNQVVLKLSDGHFAQYAHMSKLGVHAGQKVHAGDRVGLSGNTGNSTGPHLHFEIRTANRYGAVIDPIKYLSAHGASNF